MKNSPRLKQLLSMYENDPMDSFVIFALAKEYENLANDAMALQFYLELKSKDKDYVGLYYHLANLYVELEQSDNAIRSFEEGIEIAKSQNDQHALAELQNAKLNFEMEEGL